MKQNKPLRILSLIFAVIVMAVIFILSSQPGEASDKTSMSFAALFFGGDIEFALNVLIRKFAHMAEYAALAVPVWLFLSTFDLKKLRCDLTALGTAALYAGSDEIHQLFVEGRSGQFSDVLVDTFGAALGIVFISLLIHFLRNIKRKSSKQNGQKI